MTDVIVTFTEVADVNHILKVIQLYCDIWKSHMLADVIAIMTDVVVIL